MPHDRRFRFGVQLSQPLPGRTWADTARTVEDLGYSTLFVPDHFGDQLAPLTALAVAAQATTALRVGALVFDNDYRHPVVLATETATLDLLSGGRVELGLGAGWMRSDYEQTGMDYDSPGVRVSRFEEALDVIAGCFADGPFDHSGEHYTITGLDAKPSPATPGGPPLIIGGGGRRVLTIAARRADIVGINPNLSSGAIDGEVVADAMAERVDQKVAWVRDAAGDRFDDIELNVLTFLASVTDDPEGTAAGISAMFGASATDVLDTPSVLLGTVDGICETLESRRSRWGFTYYVVQGDSAEAFAPVVDRMRGT